MPKPHEVYYFAHAVNAYNTPYEEAAIALILDTFPGASIENPNQPHHALGYKEWQERTAKSRDDHKGMDYFYDAVLPSCTGCVAMPFLDGRFGLGVAGETGKCLRVDYPTYGMFPTEGEPSEDDLVAWVADPSSGLFRIREFSPAEQEQFLTFTKDEGNSLVLGHQETRLRTWQVYGKERRPYEVAHQARMPIPEGFYPPKDA